LRRFPGRLSIALLIFVLGIPASQLNASLSWPSEIIDLSLPPESKAAHASFPFKNSGTTRVVILSIDTSCSCTKAVTKATIYQPGESGTVDVDLAIEQSSGIQQGEATVRTDDPNAPSARLVLRAHISSYLVCKPTLIYWRGDPTQLHRTIECQAGTSHPIHFVSVSSQMPGIQTTYVPSSDPQSFSIDVDIHPELAKGRGIILITIAIDEIGMRQSAVYILLR
jgi:hypothetical protein